MGNIHFRREIFIVFHICHAILSGKCGKLDFVEVHQKFKKQVFFEKKLTFLLGEILLIK